MDRDGTSNGRSVFGKKKQGFQYMAESQLAKSQLAESQLAEF